VSRIALQFAGEDPGAKPFLLAVEEHSLKNPGLPETGWHVREGA